MGIPYTGWPCLLASMEAARRPPAGPWSVLGDKGQTGPGAESSSQCDPGHPACTGGGGITQPVLSPPPWQSWAVAGDQWGLRPGGWAQALLGMASPPQGSATGTLSAHLSWVALPGAKCSKGTEAAGNTAEWVRLDVPPGSVGGRGWPLGSGAPAGQRPGLPPAHLRTAAPGSTDAAPAAASACDTGGLPGTDSLPHGPWARGSADHQGPVVPSRKQTQQIMSEGHSEGQAPGGQCQVERQERGSELLRKQLEGWAGGWLGVGRAGLRAGDGVFRWGDREPWRAVGREEHSWFWAGEGVQRQRAGLESREGRASL